MRILIFGGGGMIGQAIAKKHLAEGDEVFIYDLRLNPYIDYENMVGIDVSHGSGNLDFDVVSNQAALVGVGQSQYDINRYATNNVVAVSAMLQALLRFQKHKSCRILFAGSMGPYGEGSKKGATKETQKLDPKSVYAVTKVAQESLIKVFSDTYGTPALSLRYFSVYSTTQNPLNPYTGVLSIIANKLINSDKVELFGDGSQYRDLIEVSDVAEAHFLATRYDFKGFDVLNVGTGIPTTLHDIANTMRDIIDPSKEVIFNGKSRAGDIQGIYADITKIQEKLGWSPKISLEAGLKAYCEFIKEKKDNYRYPDTTAKENNLLNEIGLIK